MSTTPPPTIRPYTSYNLFFQLEREYILQTLLEFQPTIVPKDLFDPTDETNYRGPPLPSRYSNLILPSDWHIPGKTQRRKRSHRKSHGKIGFHEVNGRISKAWHHVDAETKEYCVTLSELESKKYKKDKKEKKDKGGVEEHNKKKVIPTKKQNKSNVPMVTTKNELADGFTNLLETLNCDVSLPQQDVNDIQTRPLPKFCRQVSRDSICSANHRRESLNSFSHSQASSSGIQEWSNASFNCSPIRSFTEVDMQDDEIIEMYKTTTFEEDIPDSLESSQVCVEIPQAKATQQTFAQNNNVLLAKREGEERKDGDIKRMSFIDAQYEMFQQIGRQFTSGKTETPGSLGRNSITACQA